MAKIATHRQGDILVMVHGAEELTNAEFEPVHAAHVEAFQANAYRVRMVVVTDASLTASQRKRAVEAGWNRGKSKAIVITLKGLVRSSVTALSWFGVAARAAHPDDYRDVLTSYLAFTPAEHDDFVRVVEDLRGQVTSAAPTADRLIAASRLAARQA